MTGLASLSDGAGGVLGLLITALAHGTVLAAIGAVLAVTVLRRARPAVLAAMWTVVLLKFVVPFGPAPALLAVMGALRAGAVAVPLDVRRIGLNGFVDAVHQLHPGLQLQCAGLRGVQRVRCRHLH